MVTSYAKDLDSDTVKSRRKDAISLIISCTSLELFNAIYEHLWAINGGVLKADNCTINDDQSSFHRGLMQLKESGLGYIVDFDYIAN